MTAKLSRKEFNISGWTFGVSMDDGSERVTTVADLTDAAIESFARAESAKRDAIAPVGKTRYNVGDLIDLTPLAQPQPSAEDKARAEYYAARGIYSRMLEDVRLGERKADDADVLAAQQNMAALRKPEYL